MVADKRQKLSRISGKGTEACKYFIPIKIPKNQNIATNLGKNFHNETIAFKKEKKLTRIMEK